MPAVLKSTVAGTGMKIGSPNIVNVEPIWCNLIYFKIVILHDGPVLNVLKVDSTGSVLSELYLTFTL